MDNEQIDRLALDFAQAEYERLTALGWSPRDAARHSQMAQEDKKASLIASTRAQDED